MKKTLLLLTGMILLSTATSAAAEEQLAKYRPLSNLDALAANESAHEVFRGQQWAVYQVDREGVCQGYALANVDTRFYMKLDQISSCAEGATVALAQVSGNDYRMTMTTRDTTLASVDLTKQ